jgi:hypothetical protein
LTEGLAVATAVATLDGPGECAVSDAVRLEAVMLPDGSRISLTPPAILRCSMAEAIAHWVREDVTAAAEELGAPLRSIDNYAPTIAAVATTSLARNSANMAGRMPSTSVQSGLGMEGDWD